uniref:Uncharacterized protein n=1 Tax=Romanomermis culicivorax TaxID=13658 RepID=A0A915JT87_ROMCU
MDNANKRPACSFFGHHSLLCEKKVAGLADFVIDYFIVLCGTISPEIQHPRRLDICLLSRGGGNAVVKHCLSQRTICHLTEEVEIFWSIFCTLSPAACGNDSKFSWHGKDPNLPSLEDSPICNDFRFSFGHEILLSFEIFASTDEKRLDFCRKLALNIIFTKSFCGALEFLTLVNITFCIWKLIKTSTAWNGVFIVLNAIVHVSKQVEISRDEKKMVKIDEESHLLSKY